jgi:hypothetical protein
MEPQVAALQNMFSVLLYGAIGFLGPSIIAFRNLDSLQDQFTSPNFDNSETFDFIVGKRFTQYTTQNSPEVGSCYYGATCKVAGLMYNKNNAVNTSKLLIS